MSSAVTVNGTAFTQPTDGDTDYAATFAALLAAIPGLLASCFQFGVTSGLTTSAVYARTGFAAADSTEVFIVCPKAGKISALYLRATSQPSGGTVTVTVRKNGSDTALTATMLTSANTASDTSNTVTVAAGDTLSVKALGNSGYSSGCANLTATFAFTPS